MQIHDPPENIRRAVSSGRPLPDGAHTWPNVQVAHRQLLEERMTSLEDPGYCGEGIGIVTCGGGIKYFPSIWVLLRTLRHLGCTLPIEVWYLGDDECDPYMRRLMREFGAQPIDANRLRRAIPRRRLAGWELKLFSIGYSSFREVLFLDADCLPFHDPTILFYWPEYQETGLVAWPDFATWIQPSTFWEVVCGSVPEGYIHPVPAYDAPRWINKPIPPGQIPNLETGQLLIDKRRAWKAWLVADFFCQYLDYYGHYLHGDCGAWLTAIHLVRQPHRIPPWYPDWVEPHTIIQFDFEHRPCFAHRTMDKWSLFSSPKPPSRPLLPQQMGEEAMEELRQKWAGQLWVNHRPTLAEQELRRRLERRWGLLRHIGVSQRLIQLGPQGEVIRGAGPHGTQWEVFIEAGQPILAFRLGQECTARLVCQADPNSWIGRDRHGRTVDLTLDIPLRTVDPSWKD